MISDLTAIGPTTSMLVPFPVRRVIVYFTV
jgi:hypothetical protein